jgi:hypothetical protein
MYINVEYRAGWLVDRGNPQRQPDGVRRWPHDHHGLRGGEDGLAATQGGGKNVREAEADLP